MAKLYFYYSAMNAGKSTSLLQAAYNYEERGMRVLLYTPLIDDRAGSGVISSRIGLSREVVAFDRDFDLFVDIKKQHDSNTVSCVFLDESQFLTPAQVLQLTLVVGGYAGRNQNDLSQRQESDHERSTGRRRQSCTRRRTSVDRTPLYFALAKRI